MNRTFIGVRNGQFGVYISQPGEDVMTTTKSLLLDSRYDMLKVHHSAIVGLNRGSFGPHPNGGGSGYRYFIRDVAFPALPYLPLFSLAFVQNQNLTCFYPPPSRNAQISNDVTLDYVGFWIGGSSGSYSSWNAEAFERTNDQDKYFDLNAVVTIFKNPVG